MVATTSESLPAQTHRVPGADLWTMSDLSHRSLSAGTVLSPSSRGTWALVLDGEVELETAREAIRLGPGDAALVRAGRTAHRLVAVRAAEIALGDLQPVLVHHDLPSPLVVRDFGSRHPAVARLVGSCAFSAACPTSAWSLSYAGLLGAAVVTSWLEDVGRPRGEGADGAVADLLAALTARPGDDWTLARMAAVSHLSRSALVTRFRRATGRSPMQVLRDLRMHEARRLLCEGDGPIAAVAHAVGFGSAAAFSRAFSSHHDVTPQSWRSAAASGPGYAR